MKTKSGPWLIIGALCLLTLLMVACNPNEKHISRSYASYAFDKQVIGKLQDYDSLVFAIQAKISLFQKDIGDKDSYRAYSYYPGSPDEDRRSKLPPGTDSIAYYFNKIDSAFIEGFDVFKDSTIKISIRSTPSTTVPIIIDEALSYFPASDSIPRKGFPIRDTVLNKHWLYWARIREMGYF